MKADKIYQIIDVNFNRCNEGLRVIEEYFRFCDINTKVQKQLKQIRHNLFELKIDFFDYKLLLKNRDSENDIGGKYITKKEVERNDIKEILVSNIKRIQEGMRVLEEYSKLVNSAAVSGFKKIRFELYILEKQIFN
jgi:thiamine-phosphate pyrophosphorylase